MFALAEVRAPSGEVVALGHGALIGRLWTADLRINDARVSEAHAMISLRGRDVRLLALRGRFLVDGRWCSDVVLAAGLTVSLAKGLDLEIVAVHAPTTVFALQAPGLARQVLTGVTALYGGPQPRIRAGWDALAHDHVWPTGDVWMRGGDPPVEIGADESWQVGGTTFRAMMLDNEGAPPTVKEADYARPVTVIARFDTVHLVRAGEPVVVITGHAARVISELVTAGTAIGWEDLARMCWQDKDRDLLRHRWDMQMRRLRLKLAGHGLRTDLLRADGFGKIELVLGLDDTVVDET
jgi:hypothetical protein